MHTANLEEEEEAAPVGEGGGAGLAAVVAAADPGPSQRSELLPSSGSACSEVSWESTGRSDNS